MLRKVIQRISSFLEGRERRSRSDCRQTARGAKGVKGTRDLVTIRSASTPLTPERLGLSPVLFFFLFLFPGSVSAENSSSPLLSKIHKAYTSSPSFTCSFVQIYAPAGFAATSPETGRLTLQAPDQVRFDYDGPDGKVFTFDGRAARQYVAADRQMVVKTLPAEDRARLPILFFESPESIAERFDAVSAPSGETVHELTLSPKKPGALKTLVLTVTDSGEVKRLVVTDSSGNKTTFTFTQKRAGGKRPASDFALVPLEGTKVVTD